MVQRRLIEVTVSGIRQLTPRVREYLLTPVTQQRLPEYQPGAHIELHLTLPGSGPLVRHYSLIGGIGLWGDSGDTYRIAVQREDRQRGSAYIHESFAIGTVLKISEPKNHFALNRRDDHSLLIAGGIGITPILSMLRSLVRRGRSFDIVYAGRSATEMAFRQDVLRLAGARARIHESGDGRHLDMAEVLASQPQGSNVYVCGPAAMVEATRQAAQQLGWDPRRVRSELFVAGPVGEETSFDVELRQSNRRIHVGNGTTILAALEAAGIHPLHDCRRGECGLCPMRVLESDGVLQHRDVYLSDEERDSQSTLCICVSRVKGSLLVLDA